MFGWILAGIVGIIGAIMQKKTVAEQTQAGSALGAQTLAAQKIAAAEATASQERIALEQTLIEKEGIKAQTALEEKKLIVSIQGQQIQTLANLKAAERIMVAGHPVQTDIFMTPRGTVEPQGFFNRINSWINNFFK